MLLGIVYSKREGNVEEEEEPREEEEEEQLAAGYRQERHRHWDE